VPAFRSSQFPKVFSFSKGVPPVATPPNPADPYGKYLENYQFSQRIGNYPKVLVTGQTDTDAVDSKVSFPEIRVDGPFGYLLNFFRTAMFNNLGADNTFNTTDDRQWNQGFAGMYRVLDLVEVPSRFVGTVSWLNPAMFSGETTQVSNTTDPRYGFQPPYNRIASRREPGRVNINTISKKEPATTSRGGKAVWDSIWHGSAKRNGTGDPGSHIGPDDDDFYLARRGYWSATTGPGLGTKVDENTLLNPMYPTIFANPFRESGTGNLVPLPQMMRTDADVTLARSFNGTTVNGVVAPQSMGEPFVSTAAFASTDNNPFTLEVPANRHHDSARNSYFRYAPISRLSSMTTNRSNVFAVWVTIGFFEVEEIPPWTGSADQITRFGTKAVYDRVYPDGYTFGKEAGIDTGETVRYREFAIIDRTIPVGFEPGANHNARETIRLQRKIE
jgi:hypothetical protein